MTRGELTFLTSNGLRRFQRDLNAPFLNQRCLMSSRLDTVLAVFFRLCVSCFFYLHSWVTSQAKSLDSVFSFGYFSINIIVMVRFYTYV